MTDEVLKKLGAELRKTRLAQGLTQNELADKASIGRNRYAIIERGEAKNITLKTLEDIAKVLGIKVKDILPF